MSSSAISKGKNMKQNEYAIDQDVRLKSGGTK